MGNLHSHDVPIIGALVDLYDAVADGIGELAGSDKPDQPYVYIFKDEKGERVTVELSKEWREKVININHGFIVNSLSLWLGLPVGKIRYIPVKQTQYSIDKTITPEEMFSLNLGFAMLEQYTDGLSSAELEAGELRMRLAKLNIQQGDSKYRERWPFQFFGAQAINVFEKAYKDSERMTIVRQYADMMYITNIGVFPEDRGVPSPMPWMFPGMDYTVVDGVHEKAERRLGKDDYVYWLGLCEDLIDSASFSLPYKLLLHNQYAPLWPPFLPSPSGTRDVSLIYNRYTRELGFRDAIAYSKQEKMISLVKTCAEEGGDSFRFMFIARVYEMFYKRNIPLGGRVVKPLGAIGHTLWVIPDFTADDMRHVIERPPPNINPPAPRPPFIDPPNKEIPPTPPDDDRPKPPIIDPPKPPVPPDPPKPPVPPDPPKPPVPPDPPGPPGPPPPVPRPVVLPISTTIVQLQPKEPVEETGLVLYVHNEEPSPLNMIMGVAAIGAGAYMMLKKE